MSEYVRKGMYTMKLNVDCLRDIIIAVSNNLVPDEYGNITPISPTDLAQSDLSQYPQNEILYWIRQLIDCGIIIPGKKYIDQSMPFIKDLSISGYQFIETTKNATIWEKIKPKLLSVSIGSISIFIQKAVEIGIDLIPK